MDTASIEVNRRARRTKTNRIDALKLVTMHPRVLGERRVFVEVRVPSAAAGGGAPSELRAHCAGAAQTRLQSDRQLAGDVRLPLDGADAPAAPVWTGGRDWADAPLPTQVQARIACAAIRRSPVDVT